MEVLVHLAYGSEELNEDNCSTANGLTKKITCRNFMEMKKRNWTCSPLQVQDHTPDF